MVKDVHVQSRAGEVTKSLRIHHLLCIPLFVGEGYSGGFSRNMAAVIRTLKDNADQPLAAAAGPDMICRGCPNLEEDGICVNSRLIKETSVHGNDKSLLCGVDKKDMELAKHVGITPGCSYTFREMMEMAREKVTKEIFEESCGNCQWYLRGLCSYEKWSDAF
ncbi:MAG: DUF1284 domain-containing protein [Eubacteriales bacterium]|nr:DUF1284 domain-containing protein [Eubacteriales bacterium]